MQPYPDAVERSTPGLTPRKQPQVWPPALSRGQLRHLLSVPTTSSPRRPHAAAEGGTHPHPLPPHDASGCDPSSSSAPLPHPLREPARPHDSARAERPGPSHTITHAGRPPPMWACTALGSQAVSQAPPWAILPSPRTSRPRDTRAPDRTRCGLRCPPLPPNRPPMSAGLGPREPLPPGHIHIALPPLPVSGSERSAPPPYLGGEISSPTLPAAQRSPSRRPRQGRGRAITLPHTRAASSAACSSPLPLAAAPLMHTRLGWPSSSAATNALEAPPAGTHACAGPRLLPADPASQTRLSPRPPLLSRSPSCTAALSATGSRGAARA